MAVVGVNSANSQLKMVGAVQNIHQINHVNSHNFFHAVSTTNTVLSISIIISIMTAWSRLRISK